MEFPGCFRRRKRGSGGASPPSVPCGQYLRGIRRRHQILERLLRVIQTGKDPDRTMIRIQEYVAAYFREPIRAGNLADKVTACSALLPVPANYINRVHLKRGHAAGNQRGNPSQPSPLRLAMTTSRIFPSASRTSFRFRQACTGGRTPMPVQNKHETPPAVRRPEAF